MRLEIGHGNERQATRQHPRFNQKPNQLIGVSWSFRDGAVNPNELESGVGLDGLGRRRVSRRLPGDFTRLRFAIEAIWCLIWYCGFSIEIFHCFQININHFRERIDGTSFFFLFFSFFNPFSGFISIFFCFKFVLIFSFINWLSVLVSAWCWSCCDWNEEEEEDQEEEKKVLDCVSPGPCCSRRRWSRCWRRRLRRRLRRRTAP